MPHRRLPRGVCKHNISEETDTQQISNLEVLEPALGVENQLNTRTHDTPTHDGNNNSEGVRSPPTHPGAVQRHLHCKAGNGRVFNLLTLPPPSSINSMGFLKVVFIIFFKKNTSPFTSTAPQEEPPPCWQCRPVEWPPPACWPRVELIYG